MLINLVQDAKANVPLFMLQNKYKLNGAEILNILNKMRN